MQRGFGKVILLGEHAVVYGYPAIAAALQDIAVDAVAVPATQATLSIEPWNKVIVAGNSSTEQDLALQRGFEALLACYGETPCKLHVRARVALPPGAGLGCSAALGVAIVKAIDEAMQLSRSAFEVAELSLHWERVFHGNPSGVDSAVAAHGGVLRFAKHQPIRMLRLAKPVHFVVAISHQAASTKTMVDSVAAQHARDPERVTKVFEAIAVLVDKSQTALETGSVSELGSYLNLNHAMLSSLLLSTPDIESLCEVARQSGALGAKLTGAGGGGAMLALAADMTQATSIQKALAALSSQCFTVTVHESSILEGSR